jgi:hypothetical protein
LPEGIIFLDFLLPSLLAEVCKTVDRPLNTGAYLIFLIDYALMPTRVLVFFKFGVTFASYTFLLLFLTFEFSLSEDSSLKLSL